MSFLRRLAAIPSTRTPWTATRHSRHFTTSRLWTPKTLTKTVLFGGALIASPLLFSTVYAEDNKQPSDTDVLLDPETITDAATGIAFPKSIRITNKAHAPTMTLIGLGVRTVSFLGIKVYSVGFYADLNNPDLKLSESMSVDEKIENVVRSCACVVRLVPTRDTSFTHLRDAFVRAVGARMLLRRKSGELSEEDSIELATPMRKLKTLFPNSPLKKHVPLDIFLTPPTQGRPRALIFRDLGGIESDWMSVEFILHYFDGKNPPSPPLKKTVTETLGPLAK
ncbi:hypothetical protein BDZ89DRAFT_1061803 [Hymenopellis radicata]|nr:hypothetical protein BDZ89DRAFT_1061803 [Hymenopellis radicata]